LLFEADMARVTGIGGIFFRAQDPARVRTWYRQHLGITHYEVSVWQQEAGPTEFTPFAADSDYFAADKQWMLNLRVDDLTERRGHPGGNARRLGRRRQLRHLCPHSRSGRDADRALAAT
jgi:hypothetical protein